MKKLLLLVGLVVFLAPMVVSAKKPLDEIYYCKKERQTKNFTSCLPICSKAKDYVDCPLRCSCYVDNPNNKIDHHRGVAFTNTEFYEKGFITKKEYEANLQKVQNVNEETYSSFEYLYANEDYYEILGVKNTKKYDDKIFGAILDVVFNQKIKREGVWDPIYYRCNNKDGIVEDKRFSIKRESLLLTQGLDVNFNQKPCSTILCTNQVKEAYCVLSDPEKRIAYELYGIEGLDNPFLHHYNDLAMALGCGIERKDKDDCVKKYLSHLIGIGSIDDDELDKIKKDKELMGEVVHLVQVINRAQAASPNQPPPREGAPQNQANATSNPTWRTDGAGRGYWDYGNGFGWMPGNKIYDKIISGFSIDNNIKQRLYTGSGRSVTMSNGRVNIW